MDVRLGGAERDHLITNRSTLPSAPGKQIIIWPESPGPLYYYRDPTFHREAMQLAQTDAQPIFCSERWPKRADGAPLNSAVLLAPTARW